MKILKNHEVSVGSVFNHWFVPRLHVVLSLFHQRCFILNTTKDINNSTNPTLLS